ncbi:DUF29 domain-containing protein [Gammaproteobacteria bacterium]
MVALTCIDELTNLYEIDYDAWLHRNLELLRQSRFTELDVEHRVEEMEDLGRKDRGELISRLVILIAHLLKWQFQPAHRSFSWRGSIAEQRMRVARQLKLSPSLNPFLSQAICEAYDDAVELACEETGLPLDAFPRDCPYLPTQLLDKGFFPES